MLWCLIHVLMLTVMPIPATEATSKSEYSGPRKATLITVITISTLRGGSFPIELVFRERLLFMAGGEVR